MSSLHNGHKLIVRDVEAELLPDDGADTFNAIGIKAIICCPLIKSGRLCAMMAVHQETPRDWTLGEVAIVQDVVEPCWARRPAGYHPAQGDRTPRGTAQAAGGCLARAVQLMNERTDDLQVFLTADPKG
jgi:hypothetical protein